MILLTIVITADIVLRDHSATTCRSILVIGALLCNKGVDTSAMMSLYYKYLSNLTSI